MIPPLLLTLLTPFQSLFRRSSWIKAQILLAGTILATGKRTVTQALRATGRSDDKGFALFHHLLNRAVWSPLQAARKLLLMLLEFLDDGKQPLVFGLDETIERRWGPQNRGARHLSRHRRVLHQATLSRPAACVGLH